MLSEILLASVKTKREEKPDRVPGITCSQLFPCAYRLYKIHIGEVWEEELTPQQVLNMEDGWTQEEQSIVRLREKASIIIEDRQVSVKVGKSRIPGHIDGTVTLNGQKRLWEHKAWSESSFNWLVSKGINAYPGQKAQVNAYMLGLGLDECIFFVKKKDNNDYFDCLVKLDVTFVNQILDWADKIRLEGWVPEPKLSEYCAYCGTKCFGQVLDLSRIGEVSQPEMAEKWKKGNALVKVGDMLKEEARAFFIKEIGYQDVLLVEDLKVQKIVQHRFDISKQKLIQEYGPESLLKVGETKEVTMYRIQEV